MLQLQLPMWLDRGARAVWNGRDTRGHYATADSVADRYPDVPVCRHACCRGQRKHPAGLPVMKAKKGTSSTTKRKAPAKKKAPAKRKRTSAADRRADQLAREFGGPWRSTSSTSSTRSTTTAAQRKATDTRRRRHDFDIYLHEREQAATAATNGYMVNAAGKKRGYTGSDFFKPGPRPSVATYGTDEMREWFRSHRVLSATEFARQQKAA